MRVNFFKVLFGLVILSAAWMPSKIPLVAAKESTAVQISLIFQNVNDQDTAIQGPEDSMRRDAEEYAKYFNVDIFEAIRRLELQDNIGDLNGNLGEMESETFAGLWIQHQPEFRVIVQFTKEGEELIQPYIENTSLSDSVEIRLINTSLDNLEVDRVRTAQIVQSLGLDMFTGIDVKENRVNLYVLDPEQLAASLQEANYDLPANVKVIKVQQLLTPMTDIFGGLALTTCTSGFSVKNSSGTKGITTAGHCDNTQQYNGVNLPFQAGTVPGSDPYDIQWHTAPGFTVRNLIFDGTYNRYIYSVEWKNNQTVGEWVCKYGKNTGYACGPIEEIGINGQNVRVNISVEGGDSGGPWFWNNTAYGTTMYRAIFPDGHIEAIYGPVDQIYNILGLTILTN